MSEKSLRDLRPNDAQSDVRVSKGRCQETRIAERVDAARAAWPGVQIPTEEFVRYVAERLPADHPLDGLHAMNTSELYLACACLRGDDWALRTLETEHFGMIEAAVARLCASPTFIDEVKQIVREEVLVGVGGRQPALTGYSGRGALGGWLRVMAVRTALRLLKNQGGTKAVEPDLANHLPSPRDAELENLKARYHVEFREAVETAIRALSHQQRNLLRYHYVDGLTLDEIALLYHAHRATIARWLAKARHEIFDRTRRLLTAKLELDGADYDSVLRLIRSQMHITLSELLLHRSELDGGQASGGKA